MNVLAALASAALTVGLYFMKRQAEHLPSLGGGWRPSAWWAFVHDPWWVAGVLLQIVSYAMYLAALRGAPLSVVHTALNAGGGPALSFSHCLVSASTSVGWSGLVSPR
jgi:hypothetical protein